MSRRFRFSIAIFGALWAAIVAGSRALTEPLWPTDFDQMRFAVHALLRGQNPYALIGPGLEFPWDWGLYYPIHAPLLCAPFSWLSVAGGRVAFATVAGGVFGYALARNRIGWLPAFLSAAFMIATTRTQWSPLITAALVIPALGFILPAKPNLGLIPLIGTPSRSLLVSTLIGGTLLAILGWILLPTWVVDWLAIVRRGEQKFLTLLTPVGPVVLLSLLRWRRPETRVLLALSCIPRTPSLYDILPLFVVPKTLRESSVLSLATHALFWTVVALGPFPTFDLYARELGRLEPVFMYAPAVFMILRRPNVSEPLWRTDDATSASVAESGGSLQQLSRADLSIVTVLVLCSALLFWVTVTTKRL